MVQFQQILYFLKIAELRSINKAAAELYVSQPSLSQAMKNLEDELNVSLFKRSNKGVILTEEGKRFLQYAEKIADQMELIDHMAREKKESYLAVSLYPMAATAKLTAEFYKQIGKRPIEIIVDEYRLSKVIDLVNTSIVEIGIVQVNMRQQKEFSRQLRSKGLEYEKLTSGTWHIIVAPWHPLAKRGEVCINELKQYPLIRARDDLYSDLSALIRVEDSRWGDFDKVFFANDGLTRLSLLKKTDAFLTCPTWCIDDYREFGFQVLELKENDLKTDLGWICRKRETLTQAARTFMDITKKYFEVQ